MKELNELAWFKSSYSADQGSCVEIADARAVTGAVMVRDSKDPHSPVLPFNPATFAGFISDVRAGRYDV